jgi:hypothetical protein
MIALLVAAAVQTGELDLVFVADASNSMRRTDPDGLRFRLARALAEAVAGRAAVRVSVLPFAGWSESEGRDPAPVLRAPDASGLARVTPFGDASDPNVAFERGLAKVLEAGAKKPIWVVVLTDGEFDVVEPRVRPEYDEVARSAFAADYRTDRDVALLKAAMRRLEGTIQALRVPLAISAVSFGKADAAPGPALPGGRVHRASGSALRDVLAPLIAESPVFRPGRDVFHDARHILAGTREFRVLTWGAGDRPLPTLRDPRPGRFEPDAPAGVELLAWSLVDFPLAAKLLSPARAGAGEPIEFDVSPADVEAVARIAPPSGAPVSIPARGRTSHATAAPGEYRIAVRAELAPPGGLPGVVLRAEAPEIRVTAVPAVDASFERPEAWVGQAVGIRARPRGAPASGPLALTLEGPSKAAVELSPEGGEWRGEFRPGAPGRWSFAAESGGASIRPAGGLEAKARAIRLLVDGRPAGEVDLPVNYAERSEIPVDWKVEIDRGAEEQADLELAFAGRPGLSIESAGGTARRVRIGTDEALPAEVGRIEIRGSVAGRSLAASIPLRLAFPDRAGKAFRAALPWMLPPLALGMLVAWWAMLARFGERELRLAEGGRLETAYPLAAWKRGLAGREALGTPELKDALLFRMRGLRASPTCAGAAAREGVRLLRNGAPAAGPVELRHGDELVVHEGREERVYYFFERRPTEEELRALRSAQEEKDNLYLEND